MRDHRTLLAVLAAAALLMAIPSAGAAQQQTPAQPGVIVVSYFKCDMATMPQFAEWRKANWTPLVDQAVREGRLMGYGELEHAWGDEWNYVHYYVARDIPSFHEAYGQIAAEAAKRDPQFIATVGRFCSEHKDNIYDVAHVAPPPAPPARRE